MSSVRLSKKHGLNPTIPVCYFCGRAKNEVALLGAAGDKIAKAMGRDSGEMPMHACIDRNPCEECEKLMKDNILFIIVKDGCTNADELDKRIACAAIPEDIVKKSINADVLDDILGPRVLCMSETDAKQIGVLRNEK